MGPSPGNILQTSTYLIEMIIKFGPLLSLVKATTSTDISTIYTRRESTDYHSFFTPLLSVEHKERNDRLSLIHYSIVLLVSYSQELYQSKLQFQQSNASNNHSPLTTNGLLLLLLLLLLSHNNNNGLQHLIIIVLSLSLPSQPQLLLIYVVQ